MVAGSGSTELTMDTTPQRMSPRRLRVALTGLMLALFVSMLSSTIVSNALPRIIGDLGGNQTGYSWVVVATLLALTATTPIWGKLADLFDKLLLIQAAMLLYVAGSLVGAFSHSMTVLLVARAIQGIGAGGLSSLSLVIVGWVGTPRERARFSGYVGAVYAVATLAGPLIGGVIVDSPLGWRGCFFASLPIAVVAMVLLHLTLRLPRGRSPVRIDLTGSALVVTSVGLLLVWTSLVGQQFPWVSVSTAWMLGGGLLIGVVAVVFELRHPEPVLPLRLFRNRNVLLATLASGLLATAAFASTLYPAQYFQLARGMSPQAAGLMTMTTIGALALASVVSGRKIGGRHWRVWLVSGTAAVALGLALLGTVDVHTHLVVVGGYLGVLGLGLGLTTQNLVVAVQNNVELRDLGAGSAMAGFARSFGGAVGVCVMGAVLSARTATKVADGLPGLGRTSGPLPEQGRIPILDTLSPPVRELYSSAYGTAFGDAFLVITPLAALSIVCVFLLRPAIRSEGPPMPPEITA
ncbi:MFS transporter [Amycolatopsis sp. GM8]|uniref:MFS transporter n=1 Tax=Amycolatopsis sp. GM8 TaxID=2896530 RepID=UPI001F014DCD|nr:MFS transporter [Amycolatopsis sp. GM8]